MMEQDGKKLRMGNEMTDTGRET